jgi:hypothetical protein
MDWAKAIDRNRQALIAVVAALFRMLGLEGDSSVSRLPRHIHRAVLRGLRPAESAARRLIVIAARGLVATPVPVSRPKPPGVIAKAGRRPSGLRLAFQLHDPRKSFTSRRRRRSVQSTLPSIGVIGFDPTVLALWPSSPSVADPAPTPDDDGLINGLPLCRRLRALKAALEDVPRQAQRLVRWQAGRERQQALRPRFATPLRPGLPPGYRRKPVSEVDAVLIECHGLACDAMRLDTS